jgi:hypothetical protein
MACKIWLSSDKSGGIGFPWRTLQNAQFRVQTVPKIKKVSTPLEKHSPRLGHLASWQMELGTSFSSHWDNFFVALDFVLDCFNQLGNRMGLDVSETSTTGESRSFVTMLKYYQFGEWGSRPRMLYKA